MKFNLSFPCSAKWDEMSGSERKKRCGHCDKFVHNFSELEETEVVRLLHEEDTCARFSTNSRGEVRTKSGFAKGVLLASILAGCGGLETPSSNAGEEKVELQEIETTENEHPENSEASEKPEEPLGAENIVGQVAIPAEHIKEEEEVIMMGGPKKAPPVKKDKIKDPAQPKIGRVLPKKDKKFEPAPKKE